MVIKNLPPPPPRRSVPPVRACRALIPRARAPARFCARARVLACARVLVCARVRSGGLRTARILAGREGGGSKEAGPAWKGEGEGRWGLNFLGRASRSVTLDRLDVHPSIQLGDGDSEPDWSPKRVVVRSPELSQVRNKVSVHII